jgi:hypothetical protein
VKLAQRFNSIQAGKPSRSDSEAKCLVLWKIMVIKALISQSEKEKSKA